MGHCYSPALDYKRLIGQKVYPRTDFLQLLKRHRGLSTAHTWTHVELFGLSATEYNGVKGYVLAFENGRFQVKRSSNDLLNPFQVGLPSGKTIRVREQNLRPGAASKLPLVFFTFFFVDGNFQPLEAGQRLDVRQMTEAH